MKLNKYKWAIKIFFLSISLSIIFSVISQSLFPKLSILLSIMVIFFFIVLSVVFDMIGVAVASIDKGSLEKYKKMRGYRSANLLCNNTEKVSSFCCDVIGDICGILSGAGGVSLVLNMKITDQSTYFVVTCIISSLIAGLTIFGKAIMKTYAVKNCDKVMIKTGKIMEMSLLSLFKRKENIKSKHKEEKHKRL